MGTGGSGERRNGTPPGLKSSVKGGSRKGDRDLRGFLFAEADNSRLLKCPSYSDRRYIRAIYANFRGRWDRKTLDQAIIELSALKYGGSNSR